MIPAAALSTCDSLVAGAPFLRSKGGELTDCEDSFPHASLCEGRSYAS